MAVTHYTHSLTVLTHTLTPSSTYSHTTHMNEHQNYDSQDKEWHETPENDNTSV